jgi:hypothetical protein
MTFGKFITRNIRASPSGLRTKNFWRGSALVVAEEPRRDRRSEDARALGRRWSRRRWGIFGFLGLRLSRQRLRQVDRPGISARDRGQRANEPPGGRAGSRRSRCAVACYPTLDTSSQVVAGRGGHRGQLRCEGSYRVRVRRTAWCQSRRPGRRSPPFRDCESRPPIHAALPQSATVRPAGYHA